MRSEKTALAGTGGRGIQTTNDFGILSVIPWSSIDAGDHADFVTGSDPVAQRWLATQIRQTDTGVARGEGVLFVSPGCLPILTLRRAISGVNVTDTYCIGSPIVSGYILMNQAFEARIEHAEGRHSHQVRATCLPKQHSKPPTERLHSHPSQANRPAASSNRNLPGGGLTKHILEFLARRVVELVEPCHELWRRGGVRDGGYGDRHGDKYGTVDMGTGSRGQGRVAGVRVMGPQGYAVTTPPVVAREAS